LIVAQLEVLGTSELFGALVDRSVNRAHTRKSIRTMVVPTWNVLNVKGEVLRFHNPPTEPTRFRFGLEVLDEDIVSDEGKYPADEVMPEVVHAKNGGRTLLDVRGPEKLVPFESLTRVTHCILSLFIVFLIEYRALTNPTTISSEKEPAVEVWVLEDGVRREELFQQLKGLLLLGC
jgi:hypothetical protein